MLWYTIFASAVTITLGASVSNFLDGRIVGGEDTTIEQFPYQVSIQENLGHVCGGSILSDKYIVTAAHCITGVEIDAVTVVVGFTKLDEADAQGRRFLVASLTEHPDYEYPYNDIAIVTLEETVEFGPGVAVIAPAARGYDPAPGSKVVVSGWGVTEDGYLSNNLKKVEIEVVDRKVCQKKYVDLTTSITNAMICAGTEKGGKAACEGDSGGPLVENGVLIGVVSHGRKCGDPNFPGVYSSVGALRDFITTNTNI